MPLTKVIALSQGHDGRFFREANEVFDVDLADQRFKGATWFVPLDKAPKAAPKKTAANARPLGAGPLPGSAVKEDPPPAGDDLV